MDDLVKKSDFASQLREEIDELGGDELGPIMKFDANQSMYFIGTDEAPKGCKYIAHVRQYARGHTKFVDKRPIEKHIKKITEGKPPRRQELDEPEKAGKENDPWVYQHFLPLEDAETGNVVVFVGKTVGVRIALNKLFKEYARNIRRGLPIVKPATDHFPTKDYGKRARPDFPIVGWRQEQSLDDAHEIPEPPETDPDDPGFEPDDFSR